MHRLVKLGFVAIVSAKCFAATSPPALGNKAARIIDDAPTGNRWVLERNPDHPGGPGRMIKLVGGATKKLPADDAKLVPIIRAGDNVVVEDKNTFVSMRLEGLALGRAARGEQVTVRLKAGGGVVRAIAEAPGRARLAGAAQ